MCIHVEEAAAGHQSEACSRGGPRDAGKAPHQEEGKGEEGRVGQEHPADDISGPEARPSPEPDGEDDGGQE